VPSVNESIEISAEERRLYNEFRNKNPSSGKSTTKASAYKSPVSHERASTDLKGTPGLLRLKTPGDGQDFSFNRTTNSDVKSFKSASPHLADQRDLQGRKTPESDSGSKHRSGDRQAHSYYSPHSQKDSEGKISTKSDNLAYKVTSKLNFKSDQKFKLNNPMAEVPETQQRLDELLDQEGLDINIQITAKEEAELPSPEQPGLRQDVKKTPPSSNQKNNVSRQDQNLSHDKSLGQAGYTIEIHDGQNIIQEETKAEGENEEKAGKTAERKEYTLYDDWRIIEVIEDYKKLNGTKGLLSHSLWDKLKDPKTNQKLLQGVRTTESLRDRYKRTIALLSDEDIEKIKKFAREHTEEECLHHYCQFKKVNGLKKLTQIASRPSYDPNNLKRKTPYNQVNPPKTDKTIEQATKQKTRGNRTVGNMLKGHLESHFDLGDDESGNFPYKDYEYDNDNDMSEEDISNFTESQLPRRSMGYDEAHSKRNSLSNQRGMMVEENPHMIATSTNIHKARETERILIPNVKQIPTLTVSRPQHTDPQPADNKRRKSYEEERLLIRDAGEIKRVKPSEEYTKRSLVVSEAFKEKKKSPEPWTFDENLTIYVDKARKVRFAIKEQPLVDMEKEKEMKRLLSLAREYQISFEQLMELFQKVSCDCDDLENYLKSGNEALLWDSQEDKDLIENNTTALRYLRLIKGDERIERRRVFLTEQANQQ